MIKDNKYRFTLQFGMESEEEKCAGQLLESLGKRKSPVVVAALNEYIDHHPEMLEGKLKIQFQIRTISPANLEEQIRQLIEERLGSAFLESKEERVLINESSTVSDDILDMLSDLDCFN